MLHLAFPDCYSNPLSLLFLKHKFHLLYPAVIQ